jgi:hypothetical protein
MRARFIVAMLICAATAGVLGSQAPALAQEKTVKACQAEWRANRVANQSAGITEKAYVDKCRAGGQAASPTPAQAPATPTPPPGRAPASVPAGKTTGSTPGLGTPSGANEFSAESQAKSHCPSGTVVWANLQSKIYRFAGSKDYGATKRGAYMCEQDATAQGIRAAKNEKHP